jgi:ribosomal protein S27E
MSNVVNIDDVRITRTRMGYDRRDECKHRKLTFDEHGEIVTCDDCHKQVTAFWVVTMLAEVYAKALEKVASDQRRLNEAKAKDISLLAAQKVEKAWRSRSMVPTCPHCHEAIFPQDGFGGSATNRAIAVRRREVECAQPRVEA